MRKLWIPIALALLLGACVGGFTADQNMAIACRGYAGTLGVLALYKRDMTAEQEASVDAGKLVISPLCRQAATGEIMDYQKSLIDVRNELRQMLILEREIKQ